MFGKVTSKNVIVSSTWPNGRRDPAPHTMGLCQHNVAQSYCLFDAAESRQIEAK